MKRAETSPNDDRVLNKRGVSCRERLDRSRAEVFIGFYLRKIPSRIDSTCSSPLRELSTSLKYNVHLRFLHARQACDFSGGTIAASCASGITCQAKRIPELPTWR